MDPDTDPSNPSRPRGILSKSDREYLLGEREIETGSQVERNTRGRIRERVFNALLDFYLVRTQLEERDRQQIFYPDGRDAHKAVRIGLEEIVTLAYEYAPHDPNDATERRETLQAMLEYAVSKVDGVRGTADVAEERVYTLAQPEVSIDIQYPKKVSLEDLESQLAQQPDDLDEWDWSVFDQTDLLFLLWYTGAIDDEFPAFDQHLIRVLRDRLADEWTLRVSVGGRSAWEARQAGDVSEFPSHLHLNAPPFQNGNDDPQEGSATKNQDRGK